ncbi:MAG TPA: sulfatase/phosphatase domain-containing protein, partial [Chitinophagaceae bacterium]|nr:sulfatase/phosphatase domain-containing protein [Chitinophagaceae bacterium]
SDRYKLIYFYENKEWEFYDLQKDIHEVNNLYANPLYKNQIAAMKKTLSDHHYDRMDFFIAKRCLNYC